MVDSEIIEKQIYAFFPLSNIKKEKTKQVKIQEGGQIISPPPTPDTLQLTETNRLVT